MMKRILLSQNQAFDLQSRYQTVLKSLFTVFLMVCSLGVWGQRTYTLITSNSQLEAGAKYLFVGINTTNYYGMSSQSGNNRPSVSITIAANNTTVTPATVITDTTNPYEITLGGSTNSWTFFDSVNSTFLRPRTGANNGLQGQATTANATWQVTVAANGVASIVCENTTTYPRNVLQFNYNGGSPLFSCYASASQTAVFLYKEVPSGFTVTYNGNANTTGSVPSDNTNYTSGATVTVLGNTGSLVKTNYNFTGWNTLADGSGTDRAAASTFNISANTTLYAKWTGNVTYNANGGTGTTTDGTNYLAGASVTTAVNGFSYTGFTFSGWNTQANGLGTDYTASQANAFNFSGNVTLYAKWTSAYSITFANLQFPGSQTINEGSTFALYGQVYAAGLTEAAGAGAGIIAEVGYSSSNTNPNTAGWTWSSANFNAQVGNNDEYIGTLGSGITPGTYYYATRFKIGSAGTWVYGGYNTNTPTAGGIWNGTANVSGVLTVNSNLVGYANIQSPYTGNIAQGTDFNVYAQVYKAGITDIGPIDSSKIKSWIGISTTNATAESDFASWTWIPASFNTKTGNNFEYFANIAGATRPTGTYYYVSRFQITGSSEYRYGGTNNNFWTGAANSGVLNVYTAPVITSALTKSSIYGAADTYTITATGSPTISYNATGLPTGLSINTTTGVISGTVTANVATYNVTISATNGGATDSKTLVWTITKKPLTITGLTGVNKIYDATTSATLSGTPVLNTIVSGDDVSIAGTPTASFASKTIGTAKPITVTGYTLGGTKAGNYTVSQPTGLTANITAKTLTVTGATAQNKVYDGTTAATITGATLVGVISPDVVTVSGGGTFASANVNTGIAVTAGLSLAGADSGNYTLTQPTGLTADITKANPVFTTSAIAVLVGGSYTLPGANISSTSNGILSYSMIDNAAATLTGGNTINGIAVGTNTLTVNQAASANYNVGSTTVGVNVTTFSNGDFKTTGDGFWNNKNDTFSTVTWAKYNSSTNNWDPIATGPSAIDTNVYIFNIVEIPTSTTINGNFKIIIENNSKLTFKSSSIWTFRNIDIKAGGILDMQTKFTVLSSGNFEIEDDGNFWFNYPSNAASTLTSNLWAGIERFHPQSNFIVKNHDTGSGIYFLPPATNLTANTYNAVTAYFGNLIFDSAGGEVRLTTNNFNNATLTHGNLEIRPNGSYAILYDDVNWTIGKDLIIGQNSAAPSAIPNLAVTTSAKTIILNVKGNFINNSTSGFRLVNNTAGNVTLNVDGNITINGGQLELSNTNGGIGTVNLKGNLIIDSSGKLLSTPATGSNTFVSNFNFVGILPQNIDIATSVATPNRENCYINFNVKPNAYVQLLNRDFQLGTNSKLTVENNGTLDFGFDGTTALNVVRVATPTVSSGQVFDAQTGSTLKITAPAGITDYGDYTGNVQIGASALARQFAGDATYHYIGKTDQLSGNGMPNVASAKKVVVELADNTTVFQPSALYKFNSTGGLEIRKGIVLDNSTGSFSDGDLTGETGYLTMSDGRYRLFKTSTNPLLSGNYNLTGGVVEFANTNASNQTIRNKSYLNVEVTGNPVGNSNGNITILDNGTFKVKNGGEFTINSYAIVGTSGMQTITVENGGLFRTGDLSGFSGTILTSIQPSIENIILDPGSTVEYSRFGVQTITHEIPYQNLTISGSSSKTADGETTVKEMTRIISAAATLQVAATNTGTQANAFYALAGIDNSNGSTGEFILQNDAVLMQNTNADNSKAKITAQRAIKFSTDDRKEYNYLISPVKGQNLKEVYYEEPSFIPFVLALNEPNNNFVNAGLGLYAEGKGYAVKEPTKTPGFSSDLFEFKGEPANGNVSYSLTKLNTTKGYNLIGNPYPSNFDLKTFYEANNAIMLPEFKFWDNRVNKTYVQFGGAYKGYSYALYNAASDEGNPAPGGDPGDNSSAPGGTGNFSGLYRYAKIGQAFVVRAATVGGGTVNFTNNERTIQLPDRGFFGKPTLESTKDRYRLQLISPSALYMTQTVVYYSGGNNAFGIEDSKHPDVSSSDAFYSFAGDQKVIINGKNSFAHTDVVYLGVTHYAAGTYKIRAIDKIGVFENGQSIYLKDNLLNSITDITSDDYTFTSSAGQFTNRFEIVYQPGSVLASASSTKATLQLYRDELDFVVQSSAKKIVNIELYDMSGRLIFSQKANAKTVRFNAERLINGAYILKAQMEGGEIFTKKLRK